MFSKEVRHLFIRILAVDSVHIRGFNREGQDILEAFLVEPPHKKFLKFFCGFPAWSVTIGEYEVVEDRVEVIVVKICNVPEYRLIAASACWLVNCINNLREVVFKTLAQCYLMIAESFNYTIQVVNVVLTVILAGEMVEVAKKLWIRLMNEPQKESRCCGAVLEPPILVNPSRRNG